MATTKWISGAPAVAQVQDYVFAGTWEASDVINLTIGTVTVSTTATSTTTATVVSALVTTWNNLSSTYYPQFAEMTASVVTSTTFRLTGDTLGLPFVVTIATTETGGGGADAQTIDGAASSTGTATTACSGPNHWDCADNWSGDAVPIATNDVIIENSDNDILYGLAQGAIALNSLTIRQSFTGKIGLPNENASGYAEYRETYLAIRPGTMRIGDGEGAGSGRIKIDTGTAAAALTAIVNSGASVEDGVPAIVLKGLHASNTLTLTKGHVGVAIFASETCGFAAGCKIAYRDNKDSDVNLLCGTGVTFATVDMEGGQVETNSNITALNVAGGRITVMQGAVTTLIVYGGEVIYNSTGTLATATVGDDGHLSFDQDARAKTVTNAIDLQSKTARLSDRFKVVASLVVDLNFFGLGDDHPVSIGKNFRITRGATA